MTMDTKMFVPSRQDREVAILILKANESDYMYEWQLMPETANEN